MEVKYSYLISKIPSSLFEYVSSEYKVDRVNHKLTGQSLFQILLYNICEENRISLRIIEESLTNHHLEIYHKGKRLKASKSGIATRLKSIDYRFYESIFKKLEKVFNKELKKDTKTNIRLFDSTLVTLSSKLLKCDFAVPNGDKGQIKFSVGFNGLPTNVRFGMEKSDHSEDVALKASIKESSYGKDEIIVFDRGISSRKTFQEFKKTGINFVTRLNEKANCKVKKENELPELTSNASKLLEDNIVQLRSKNGWINEDFRLITIDNKGKKYRFLTNLFDLPADEVLAIYKSRWDIEVFFKFIKQHLNAKHFLSRDLNGIKVVFYMILIAALLILTFKELNNIESFKIAKKRFVEQMHRAISYDIILVYKDDPQGF